MTNVAILRYDSYTIFPATAQAAAVFGDAR